MTYRWALRFTLFFSYSLVAMDEQSQIYLPESIQQKIFLMVSTYKPLHPWMEWLIEQHKQSLQTRMLTVIRMQTLSDHSKLVMYLTERTYYLDSEGRKIFYGIPPITAEIDCVGSFNHHKTVHPFVFKTQENGTINVTFFNKNELVIDPYGKVIDSATSIDDTLFAAISEHCVMIWHINDHVLVSTIECSDHKLKRIVSFNNRSIVLQDSSNTIFAYDLAERTKHVIYSDTSCDTLYPIAFDDHYAFVHTYADSREVKITTMTDIIDLFTRLHFDQIKLLSKLHKAALTGNKLNLTSSLPGIIHARQALNNLPNKIRLLIKEFVQLPTASRFLTAIDGCAIS